MIKGTSHDDILTGTSGDDVFSIGQGGNDTAYGGDGGDTFKLGAAFTAADTIDGGTGSDKLILDGDYSVGVTFAATTITGIESIVLSAGHSYGLTLHNANVVAGKSLTVDADSLGAGDALTFDGSAELDGSFKLHAGAGNDTLTGGAQADTFYLDNGGNDSAHGGGGKDVFRLGARFTAADHIDGGASTDKLLLNGDYSGVHAVVFGASTLTNVETIMLSAGHSYALTTHDATVKNGKMLTLDAHALAFPNGVSFDATAETNGKFKFIGGNGADTITIGKMSVLAASTIDGGVTPGDHLVLNGDFSAGFTFGAATATNVENLDLVAGHDYTLTIADETALSGTTWNINGQTLGAGDNINFDGSADTDSLMHIESADGDDTLKGGTWDTTFVLHGGVDAVYGIGLSNYYRFFNDGALTAADRIYGGIYADLMYVQGDYSAGVTFANETISGVDVVNFLPGGSYNFTSADGNVASGMTLYVDGFSQGSGVGFTWNGAAETDGIFAFTGGSLNDTITGGANADSFDLSHGGDDTANGGGGNDSFDFGIEFSAADTVDGGSGTDVVNLNADYSAGATLGTLTNVETLDLASGHAYKLTASDTTVASGQTLSVNANGAANFNGSAETNGSFVFNCALNGNTLTGGAGNDTFNMATSNGTDVVTGGGGADLFNRNAINGNKTFVYNSVSDSTSTGYDHIYMLNFSGGTGEDYFKVSGIGAVTGLDGDVNGGTLSTATFDSDLATAVGSAQLAAHHVLVFQPNAGDLRFHSFLIIDENGTPGYQGGEDLVIWIQIVFGPMSMANFI